MKIYLNSLENSRKTYGRLIRKYEKGEIDRVLYRDLLYGLNGYLSYFKTEVEINDLRELERKLKELEERE